MTALRPGVIAAILRKDIQTLWPLAASALLLPLFIAANSSIEVARQVEALFAGIGALATVALILTVLQQDSPASDQQDWLTRPIGRSALLAAKVAFVCIAVALPIFVALQVDQHLKGHGWQWALLSTLSTMTASVIGVVAAFTLGLVTRNLIQVGVIAFSLVIACVVMTLLFHGFGSRGGAQWIVDLVGGVIALGFCAIALAILFRRRNAAMAQGVWIAGALLILALGGYFPKSAAVRLQQILSPAPDVAQSLVTRLIETCHAPLTGDLISELAADGLPGGWLMQVDDASVAVLSPDGGRTAVAKHTAYRPIDASGWRLVAKEAKFAPGSSLEWSHDLTLLKPAARHDLVADGQSRHVPGIGYCQAFPLRSRVDVSCFAPFDASALLRAELKGDPASICDGCGTGVNYRPGTLDGFGRTLRAIATATDRRLVLPPQTVVTLTTYEAVAHFPRRSVIDASTVASAPLCPDER